MQKFEKSMEISNGARIRQLEGALQGKSILNPFLTTYCIFFSLEELPDGKNNQKWLSFGLFDFDFPSLSGRYCALVPAATPVFPVLAKIGFYLH